MSDLKKLDIETIKQTLKEMKIDLSKKADKDWVKSLLKDLEGTGGSSKRVSTNLKDFDPEDYELKMIKKQLEKLTEADADMYSKQEEMKEEIRKLKNQVFILMNKNQGLALGIQSDQPSNESPIGDGDRENDNSDNLSDLISEFERFKKQTNFEVKFLKDTKADITQL